MGAAVKLENDVLEHLHSPRKTLLKVRELLVPNGFILATVPDVDSVIARHQGYTGQHWGAPYHLYGFTRATVRRLFRETGFEVLRCHTGPMYSGQVLVLAQKLRDP
ncbi:MAG: methyltransferase domain-containing protein [Desulfotomaculales bacterium]